MKVYIIMRISSRPMHISTFMGQDNEKSANLTT